MPKQISKKKRLHKASIKHSLFQDMLSIMVEVLSFHSLQMKPTQQNTVFYR